MIRVLHICAALDGGGVERFLLNYWKAMDKQEVIFDFVVHSKKTGILEAEIEEMGAKIYHVVPKSENLRLYTTEMKKIYMDGEYDVVHCHQGYNSWIPLFLAKRCGVKTRIAHAHTANEKLTAGGRLKKDISAYLTRKSSSEVWACSEVAGKDMWGKDSYQIVEDAIDFSKYAFDETARKEWRDKLGFGSYFVVGCVGRLHASKNHIRLLRIFRIIQNAEANTALLIVGTGPEEDNIKRTIKELGLEHVCMFGVSDRVEELLSAMDAFVLPTLYEGFGMSFLEAQANGLPTYASQYVVSQETAITRKIQYLSLEEDDEFWASKVLEEAKIRTSGDAEIFSEKYDIKVKAEELTSHYKKLVKAE